MSDAVVVAIIGLCGSGLGSLVAALISNKVWQYRIEQLEKKVEKHNSIVERTFKLEGEMSEAQHDIRDIKKKIN